MQLTKLEILEHRHRTILWSSLEFDCGITRAIRPLSRHGTAQSGILPNVVTQNIAFANDLEVPAVVIDTARLAARTARGKAAASRSGVAGWARIWTKVAGQHGRATSCNGRRKAG
jgi:hypothetical protein